MIVNDWMDLESGLFLCVVGSKGEGFVLRGRADGLGRRAGCVDILS